MAKQNIDKTVSDNDFKRYIKGKNTNRAKQGGKGKMNAQGKKNDNIKNSEKKNASRQNTAKKQSDTRKRAPKREEVAVKIAFLGGLNEVGKNMTLYVETEDFKLD